MIEEGAAQLGELVLVHPTAELGAPVEAHSWGTHWAFMSAWIARLFGEPMMPDSTVATFICMFRSPAAEVVPAIIAVTAATIADAATATQRRLEAGQLLARRGGAHAPRRQPRPGAMGLLSWGDRDREAKRETTITGTPNSPESWIKFLRSSVYLTMASRMRARPISAVAVKEFPAP